MNAASELAVALDQRYADALQVGFVGWCRADFQARDARACVTLKPAAT